MNNSTDAGGAAPPAVVHRPLSRSQGIAYISAFVVESIFIIIGNLVVLAVFGKNRQLRQRKSHWLLINQAVADLLAGLVIGPLRVKSLIFYTGFHQPDYHSNSLRAEAYIVIFSVCASLFNLLIIALERTYATFRPIKHRTLSVRNYRVATVVVWLLPVPFTCLRVAESLGLISAPTYCSFVVAVGCGIFLLIVSSYASIWIKFKCRPDVAPHNELRAAQERKLTTSVFLVTAASSMFLLSVMISAILRSGSAIIGAMSLYNVFQVYIFGVLLYCANFFINPIIYSLKMPGFRRAAIRLICGSRPRTANAALPLQTVQCNRGK